MERTRFDVPEPSKIVRCGDCGDAMHKRNGGTFSTCGCMAVRFKELVAEVKTLRAEVNELRGQLAGCQLQHGVCETHDPEASCV